MNVDLVNTHYDDFQTIDWLKDLMRDRFRHRLLRAKTQQSFLNKLLMYHDAWSGWLCVLLVGLSAGVIAAVIDIGTSWISHLKHGICLNAFWLNREQCCMYSSNKKIDVLILFTLLFDILLYQNNIDLFFFQAGHHEIFDIVM